jgi:SNF2 family DNA or RNA helicase
LKVDNTADYTLVFSISNHPQLGVLISPYVVAYTPIGTLSLTYQKVFSGNASYYTKLTSKQLKNIAILDDLMIENVIRKYSPVQKIRPKEYFRKHFDRDFHKATIRPHLERTIVKLIKSLPDNFDGLYLADDINPAAKKVSIKDDFTKVLFHFRRNENGTSYFVTLKHDDEKVPFMKQHGLLLSKKPAFLVVNHQLYKFYDFVDGAKLSIFLNRKYIHIRPESERNYYEKFIKSLLETAPVFVQGFDVVIKKEIAIPILTLVKKSNRFQLQLKFNYGGEIFPYNPKKVFHVHLEWKNNKPTFTKYKTSKIWEANRIEALKALSLEVKNDNSLSVADGSLMETLAWLRLNKNLLNETGFEIQSDLDVEYNLSTPTIHYNITDNIDWFDLDIQITVGEYTIPFKRIVNEMKKGNTEMQLPSGEYFVFPAEWFGLGEALFQSKTSKNHFEVKKYQLDILSLIKSDKIKKHLSQVVAIKKEKPSKQFNGKLRSYQQDGLSWLMFLKNNRFGGILADDMGLGKTVQTLAYLQLVKQRIKKKDPEVKIPFLLVAPTSLLFNWKAEAKEFAPNLEVSIHSGTRRVKSIDKLPKSDILITSYGLVRNDFEFLSSLSFEVIVLDESQNIKNHRSKTTQFVNKLNAKSRLALTGTPIENSIRDLWSQMNFLNKGLLGSMAGFEEKYVKPIEKKQDKEKADELQKTIKPFLLRRTKEEVAKELPPITEKVIYCEMTEKQSNVYEEVKSEYRNAILKVVEEDGLNKNRLSILQGLSKLRQIANHPKLADSEYTNDSGKHHLLMDYISTAIKENHKVLVFSQFVSYLEIIEEDIKSSKIPYLKLTGSTSKEHRDKYVNTFQNTEDFPVFLISLKAGGTGLNLTSADYVFIVDPWWNPAAEAQARDRTHRIGQVKNVFSYKFISKDTIEEKIVQLQRKKQGYSKEIIMSENNILKNLDIKDIQMLLA